MYFYYADRECNLTSHFMTLFLAEPDYYNEQGQPLFEETDIVIRGERIVNYRLFGISQQSVRINP